MKSNNFFSELKRRNVVRHGRALPGRRVAARAGRETPCLPMFGAPEWLPRSIVVLLVIGFFPALVFSWAFELTPQGFKAR